MSRNTTCIRFQKTFYSNVACLLVAATTLQFVEEKHALADISASLAPQVHKYSWHELGEAARLAVVRKQFIKALPRYKAAIIVATDSQASPEVICDLNLCLAECYRLYGDKLQSRKTLNEIAPVILNLRYCDPLLAYRLWRRMADLELDCGNIEAAAHYESNAMKLTSTIFTHDSRAYVIELRNYFAVGAKTHHPERTAAALALFLKSAVRYHKAENVAKVVGSACDGIRDNANNQILEGKVIEAAKILHLLEPFQTDTVRLLQVWSFLITKCKDGPEVIAVCHWLPDLEAIQARQSNEQISKLIEVIRNAKREIAYPYLHERWNVYCENRMGANSQMRARSTELNEMTALITELDNIDKADEVNDYWAHRTEFFQNAMAHQNTEAAAIALRSIDVDRVKTDSSAMERLPKFNARLGQLLVIQQHAEQSIKYYAQARRIYNSLPKTSQTHRLVELLKYRGLDVTKATLPTVEELNAIGWKPADQKR
jgi:hypothetical protein